MQPRECPSEDAVVRFLRRETRGDDEVQFEAHVDGCEDCRLLLAALAGSPPPRARDPEALTTELHRPGPPPVHGPALAEGSPIGRFVVVELLGAGGTGAVYAAYDPELDRTIALKLLRPEGAPEGDEARAAEDSRARILREAQATARLQHENVVAVHDVGSIGAHVFMAMELVDGQTLRRWMRGGARPWPEVVSLFRQAGQGLAAAHAAGMVHRDFKPENVFIDRGGRVRVGDFGLARPIAGPARPGEADGADGIDTGLVAGTPAYMAPECLRGEPADPRSDQFSFCVALYEALCGQRPFDGRTSEDLARAIEVGSPRPPRAVPRHLRRLLARGLAASPDQRHPSMRALLDRLAFDPRARRRRVAGAAAVALAAGVAVVAVLTGDPSASGAKLCARSSEPLRAVWNESVRSAIATAFAASGRPYSQRAADGVKAAVDRYAGRWVDMRTSACEATHVRGEQSAQLLDLRNTCLDERLERLGALTRILAHADAQVVDKAMEAAGGLADLTACADADGLRARVPPPAEPRRRATWESLRVRVAEARALQESGRYDACLVLIDRIQPDVEKLAFAPLTAELFALRGLVQDRLGRRELSLASLDRAAVEAEAGGDDRTKALAWITAAQVRAEASADPDRVDHLLDQARAASVRIGPDIWVETSLENALGQVATYRGAFPDALTHYQRTSELAEKRYGPRHLITLRTRLNVSSALDQMERDDEALAIVRPAVAILEAELGPQHPDTAAARVSLADLLSQRGQMSEALPIYERAARDLEAVVGPVSRELWVIHNAMGSLQMQQDRPAEALVHFRRALEMVEQLVGHEHRSASLFLGNIGQALAALGRTSEALAAYRESIAIADRTLGEESAFAGYANMGMAEALIDIETRAALVAAERAVRAFKKSEGPKHPDVANALLTLGRVQITLNRGDDALRSAREALAVNVEALGETHAATANARAWLGTTAYDLGQDRPAARAMVERARADFATAAAAGDVMAQGAVDGLGAWLERHP